MTRGELQRHLWLALRDLKADRHPNARNVIDNLLDAADVYAATSQAGIRAAIAASDTPLNRKLRRDELAVSGKRRTA